MVVCTAKGLSLCDEPIENYNIIVRALSSFKCPLANIVFSQSCFHRLSLNNKVVSFNTSTVECIGLVFLQKIQIFGLRSQHRVIQR